MPQKKQLAILGSTGSIGTQALEVVDQMPHKFGVTALTANNRAEKLIEQARKYSPQVVVIANPKYFPDVNNALSGLGIDVKTGEKALEEIMEREDIDLVVTALVGFSGLRPTLAALQAGKDIALANKETLVVAGELVMGQAEAKGVSILPVDSEHSALFQCLMGESLQSIEKIILTASGGPFRGYTLEQLLSVTIEQALKHPNWAMGAKITIDSASMMNKGLEVIEARWLFDLPPEKIEVIVHPQSIIHSMVQFEDGSMKAQMGLPDMRLPIQFAMGFPDRLPNRFPRFNFMDYPHLSFETVDTKVFRNLALAFQALKEGGGLPCILNAANEISNALFREGEIPFVSIAKLNEGAMKAIPFQATPGLEDLIQIDRDTRSWVKENYQSYQ